MNVEHKNQKYCLEKRRKSKVYWESLEPQPAEDSIVVLSRYYATLKRDPTFKKRVSYFVNNVDQTLSNVALFEYQGIQLVTSQSHGNAHSGQTFTRTNPKTIEKFNENLNKQQPRELFRYLKKDDSMNCARDFRVIRNQKYNARKREKSNFTRNNNVADEILDVLGMLNEHPYVQTVIHNKLQVPSIICYTKEQIKDLKHFLTNTKNQPIGIDRTFGLGNFYVTLLVYKNQRVVRKNTNDHPIFLGPLLLHKDASYKTYKSFLEHVATELDNDVENIEMRISENMELGSDDEKAQTKAIEHVFPSARRYLCTKHLKDNIKFYLQNKVGIDKVERDTVMRSLFGSEGIVDANTTIEFENRSDKLEQLIK